MLKVQLHNMVRGQLVNYKHIAYYQDTVMAIVSRQADTGVLLAWLCTLRLNVFGLHMLALCAAVLHLLVQ